MRRSSATVCLTGSPIPDGVAGLSLAERLHVLARSASEAR